MQNWGKLLSDRYGYYIRLGNYVISYNHSYEFREYHYVTIGSFESNIANYYTSKKIYMISTDRISDIRNNKREEGMVKCLGKILSSLSE